MFETNFTNPTASVVKCECGNTLEFVNGWIPDSFYCANCGMKFIPGINIGVNFPNYTLNKTQEEEKQAQENNLVESEGDNA